VRDEEAREAHSALELAKEIQDGRLHRDVERGHGLVGDEHPRLEHEGSGERDALTLPARELVRVAVAQLVTQPDGVEDCRHP
jgi:hypothetical protein